MYEPFAGIVQGLVRKPSKLDMRVRVPLPAPEKRDCFYETKVYNAFCESKSFSGIGRAPELGSRGRL